MIAYYRVVQPVPGTVLGSDAHVSYDSLTGHYLAHVPITAEAFHAALAAGAVQVSPSSDDAPALPPPSASPRGRPALRLVRRGA